MTYISLIALLPLPFLVPYRQPDRGVETEIVTLNRQVAPSKLLINKLSANGSLLSSRSLPIYDLESRPDNIKTDASGFAVGPQMLEAIASSSHNLLACLFLADVTSTVDIFSVKSGHLLSRITIRSNRPPIWVTWTPDEKLRTIEVEEGKQSVYRVTDYSPETGRIISSNLVSDEKGYPPESVGYRRRAEQAADEFRTLDIPPPLLRESTGRWSAGIFGGFYYGTSTGAVSRTADLAAARSLLPNTDKGERICVVSQSRVLTWIDIKAGEQVLRFEFVDKFLLIVVGNDKHRHINVWTLGNKPRATVVEADIIVLSPAKNYPIQRPD
jgi:hypothetical protein